MRKNLTEIVFILDRSGSMSGLEADTIGGFNSMIEKQKNAEGEALISTVLFDNTSEVIHDRVSVQSIKPMTRDDYTVRGCTALLDAIGGAIHHIGNVHKYARNEDVPEHMRSAGDDMMEHLIVGLVRVENGELDAQLLFAEGLEPVINEVPVFRDFAACVFVEHDLTENRLVKRLIVLCSQQERRYAVFASAA